jgi:hypothetical protein
MAPAGRSLLPRWAVPAIGLVLIVSILFSQVEATLAASVCLERAKTESVVCPAAPELWSIVVTVVVTIAIAFLLVRSRSDGRSR